MSFAVRFDGNPDRGPSGGLWLGILDWPSKTFSPAYGVKDFDDYYPYVASSHGTVTSSGTLSQKTTGTFKDTGAINSTISAGTNALAGVVRAGSPVTFANVKVAITEARIEAIADANTVVTVVGWSDQTDGTVVASGALAVGGNEDSLVLRWNNDETVDLVCTKDGATAVVLIDTVASGVDRTSTAHKFGIRVNNIDGTNYRIGASVDGVVKYVNTTSSVIPVVLVYPQVVQTVASTTAPSVDLDWHFSQVVKPE